VTILCLDGTEAEIALSADEVARVIHDPRFPELVADVAPARLAETEAALEDLRIAEQGWLQPPAAAGHRRTVDRPGDPNAVNYARAWRGWRRPGETVNASDRDFEGLAQGEREKDREDDEAIPSAPGSCRDQRLDRIRIRY
jgi:glycerophosphoryl diester phosphodiesterase